MTRFRKTLTASLAALTLGGAVLGTTTTPAAAWGYGYHGGWGWGGPAIAAGVIGGMALGAAAASASSGGYYACTARQPVYDAYGYVRYYRAVRVPC